MNLVIMLRDDDDTAPYFAAGIDLDITREQVDAAWAMEPLDAMIFVLVDALLEKVGKS